jgi:cobalt/nickel transport system permease protein
VVVGWAVFVVLRRVLPKRLDLVAPAAAVGALVSVPVAALVFTGLFAIGGNAPVDLAAVATAMFGWHTVIGIGEAVVTGLVVASVVAARPDLVHGARPLIAERVLETRKVVVS